MVRIGVAGVLLRAGSPAIAAQQYRIALDAAPKITHARVALAELELGRGQLAAAAQQARLVPADDPYAGLACRIELCGLIGHAESDAVADALTRAAHAGIPAVERQVFEAWAAIAAGADAPEGLPVAGAPLLGVLLEMLLRAGDGERFAALVPLLRRSQLPEREQRELLAEMYLAHGLLAQAAQEWMAACSPAPDTRGLIGLARVAERHGMLDDAANFAAGALELDPAVHHRAGAHPAVAGPSGGIAQVRWTSR